MKLEVCQKWGELDKKGFTDLTESSKTPASIAQSSKQWVGTCLYQEWLAPLLISCEAAFGYEQVAKRIANIRLCAEHGTNLTDANKKLLKHQKQEKVLRDEVKALKKVLHTTKNELSKQQMENQQLKMQSLYEN